MASLRQEQHNRIYMATLPHGSSIAYPHERRGTAARRFDRNERL
ncbi:hypothetical protein P4H71_01920 [Paenibacillus kribbensis]|nr:hypothetical protein [Paenibacillus kribbensis]MEC0233114.1 hypothetical protein [Paenibacillus kribbensis]